MSRANAVMSLVGTTAAEATSIAQEIEASVCTDGQIQRVARALRNIEGVLIARMQARQRRAREEAGVDVVFRAKWGKCEPSCQTVERFCTCGASRECFVCHTIKCETKFHD